MSMVCRPRESRFGEAVLRGDGEEDAKKRSLMLKSGMNKHCKGRMPTKYMYPSRMEVLGIFSSCAFRYRT